MNFKENETSDKLRGGYYTPSLMAQFLVNWALVGQPKSILEPSCGDGVFFKALYKDLKDKSNDTQSILIQGVELLASEVEKTRLVAQNLSNLKGISTRVDESDFLSWILNSDNARQWDVIIGNPPYIRYQYFDDEQRLHAAKIFSRAGLKFTKRTNAWVPFVVASIMNLAPGGRLAMVVPSELLHVLHANGLRNFLEQEMEHIDILDVKEMAFENVLQGVLVLRAIKNSDDSSRLLKNTRSTPTINRIDSTLDLKNHTISIVANNRSPLNGQWTHAFLNTKEFDLLERLENNFQVQQFNDIASVDIGIVTGANKFFVVDMPTVQKYKLQDIARPMITRSEILEGIIYRPNDRKKYENLGKPVFFLQFPNIDKKEMPILMRKYINIGEKMKLHERYKTGIRDRWYVVPYIWKSEIAMLKRCHIFPLIVLNVAKAYSTDTAYRIRMKDSYKDKAIALVFSFLNSLTLLSAELGGRSYGGGVLELIPSEINKLKIPLTQPTKTQFKYVDEMIRNNANINDLLEFTDPIILGNILSKNEIVVLHEARKRLEKRRLRT